MGWGRARDIDDEDDGDGVSKEMPVLLLVLPVLVMVVGAALPSVRFTKYTAYHPSSSFMVPLPPGLMLRILWAVNSSERSLTKCCSALC